MVLLTLTEPTIEAIYFCMAYDNANWVTYTKEGDPDLGNPLPGQPIAHSQILGLSRCLRNQKSRQIKSGDTRVTYLDTTLEAMLRKSMVYVEPRKPKPEPSAQYTALMARLREQEEAVAYKRMLTPALSNNCATSLSPQQIFSGTGICSISDEEEITFADINRQLALIINVLLSIVACSVAIWMAASHSRTPTRLALSMAGSSIVAIAEVTVYFGYIRRIKESKTTEKKRQEIREITSTWTTKGKATSEGQVGTFTHDQTSISKTQLRKRRKRSSDETKTT